jgi:hypothetical protein
LVEQGIENPRVGGSIPSLATILSIIHCRASALARWNQPQRVSASACLGEHRRSVSGHDIRIDLLPLVPAHGGPAG